MCWCVVAGEGIGGSAHGPRSSIQEVLMGSFQASKQLSSGAEIDKPPGTIFLVHGVFVSLAHEAERTQLRLGEVVEGGRKPPRLAEMELHSADILIPSPDHLLFSFALALGQNVRHDDHRGEE